jgi:hypothetical protein
MQPAKYAVPATMLLRDRQTSNKTGSTTNRRLTHTCNACTHAPDKLNSRTSRSQPTKQIVETSQQIVEPAQHRRGSVSCSQSETSVHVYVCTASQGKPSLTSHSLFLTPCMDSSLSLATLAHLLAHARSSRTPSRSHVHAEHLRLKAPLLLK